MKNQKLKQLVDVYSYLIEWSKEDSAFIARCIELGVCAHGSTHEQAMSEVRKAVYTGLQMLDPSEIPEPITLMEFTGKLSLRITPEKHKEITTLARSQGISINRYIASKL